MTDAPRDYDKEYTAPMRGQVRQRVGEYTAPMRGQVRQRVGVDVDRGTVTRFVVQLEYLIDPEVDEWATVVRYDHDAEGGPEATHDVTEDGLHIDIYRDGEKIDSHELYCRTEAVIQSAPERSGGEYQPFCPTV